MSTVLRPVGPLEPKVYWIRRAVLIGIILIVILLVATQCGGGGGGGGGHNRASGHNPSPTNSTTTKPIVGPCSPSELSVTVSTDTTTYTPGQAPTLTATLSNPTATTCKLARSIDNEVWTIKSGTPTVWTTKGCTSSEDPVPAQVKIAAGATKLIRTMWDGHLRGSSCQDGAAAQPGTYRLYAMIDGVTAAKPAIFHIIQ